MQFTLKKIIETKDGKEIIGINFEGKEVKFSCNDKTDINILSKLENNQIIFDDRERRILGAWSERGQLIYTAKDKQFGHDTVR